MSAKVYHLQIPSVGLPYWPMVLKTDYDALAAELTQAKQGRNDECRLRQGAEQRYMEIAAELAGAEGALVDCARINIDVMKRNRELEAALWDLIDMIGRYPHPTESEKLTKARQLVLPQSETGAELAAGCHRSHPHEDMDAGCQRLTEIARTNNARAREKP